MKTLNFGIEIEMTGVTREQAAKVMSQVLGNTYFYYGGIYDEWRAYDAQGRVWKAMSDSSISTEKKVGGHRVDAFDGKYSCEIVSPICTYEDIETVQAIVRALRAAGALVNHSCGIHIHVGAERFDAQHLRVLTNMVASKQELLIKALKVREQRLWHYCKRADQGFVTKINHDKPTTLNELLTDWYGSDPNRTCNKQHYNNTRYYILNLHAFNTKGTVEYRLFEASLHAGKIKAYIQLVLAVTAAALKARSASPRETTTDNPKYTFRCWLLRLGLIGDEFKTCRYHLLNNLEGNAAWRHEATA